MLIAQTFRGKLEMCKVPGQVQRASPSLHATAGAEQDKGRGKPRGSGSSLVLTEVNSAVVSPLPGKYRDIRAQPEGFHLC